MTKTDFMLELYTGIKALPEDELNERLDFYSEMIDDLMEEGLSEEEAVGRMGAPQEIAAQIIADTPLTKLVKEKVRSSRRIKAWEIVLIVLGFPLWLPLLAAALAVLLAVYVVLWSVVISLWAVDVALGASALACIAGCILAVILPGYAGGELFLAGAALFCAGTTIFTFFGCKAVSKYLIILTKASLLAIKRSFVRKEQE